MENLSIMQMSVWDHLGELRSRLLKCVIALALTTLSSFFFADLILSWLLKPAPLENPLTALHPAAALIQSFHISLTAGLVLALPFLLYQIWGFIRPGLSPKETKAFLCALYAGTGLFFAGVWFAYGYVIPTALKFFWQYSRHLGILPVWTVDHYIHFVLMFLLSFGLAFELPLVLILLVWFKVVSAEGIAKKRPYVIVGLAILAAFLTPPDVISQILLLIPLWLLFEIALFVSKRIE